MTTQEKIKLNKVLNKGILFVNFPGMIVMFGGIGLVYYFQKIDIISSSLMIIGFIISFVLGWLVWSLFIAKWRIWAFENIDEKFHNQLKNEAIKAKLIWPDKHLFEKTEIRNQEQKTKIKAINDRIEKLNNL